MVLFIFFLKLQNLFKESSFTVQSNLIVVWFQNVSYLMFRVVEQSICALSSWRTEAVCSVSKVTFPVVGEVGPNCEC